MHCFLVSLVVLDSFLKIYFGASELRAQETLKKHENHVLV